MNETNTGTFGEVLAFWFDELEPRQWWIKDDGFDTMIGERFGDVHRSAAMGELASWREAPEGRLAEIIVLDQFSRNIYRGRPGAFAWDGMALVLAQEAVRIGADEVIEPDRRVFLYMPFMHSESGKVHEVAVELFTRLGIESNLDYEIRHKAIIDRFGRYPHRNRILGRTSSPEEEEFLSGPRSTF